MSVNGRQLHIFIVDDTPELLDLMQELLEGEGYHVTTSRVLPDLSEIKELNPDVIVQDLLFERVQQEGLKQLRLVRLDPELATIPLILCTAAVQTLKNPELAAQLEDLRVRVVPKPFDIDDLLATLEEAVAERRIGADREIFR